jgi:YidC/Oxa1 family membrane protein insertase
MMPPPIANIAQPLIDVFDSVLVFFHDSVGFSWGLSIIALTVVVRAVLVPLTFKQFKSMQNMQRLAPEIKALQAKYKDDRQRLNQEMMKFYQENKVNPFGSCLPLVLQLPVFFSLFYMLRKDLKIDICGPEAHIEEVARQAGKTLTSIGCDQVDPGSAQFGFIPDLTAKATGGVLIVLLVMYVGSQLLSSLLMSTTVDRNQRMIFMALPFIFVPFIQSFPAGLLVYWITTNLWTVGQQYAIRKTAGPPIPVGAAAAGASAAVAPKNPTPTKREKVKADVGAKADAGAKADSNGRDTEAAAPAPRRATAPPPPPRQRRKKKTGRRR